MDVYDAITVAGAIMLFVGLWLIAPWLALTVVGTVLVAFGLLGAGAAARRDVLKAAGEESN